MPELAVTAMGVDQPGIVAAVARVLHERGGNIEDSAMTILGGRFSLVLLVTGDDDAAGLEAALREGTADLNLHLSVVDAGAAHESDEATHLLSVYGADHPGILAGISAALADVGANVTDLASRLIGGEEDRVYALVVELSTDDEDEVRQAIEAASGQLGVDWTLRALDDVTY